jgi:hypothetical protein
MIIKSNSQTIFNFTFTQVNKYLDEVIMCALQDNSLDNLGVIQFSPLRPLQFSRIAINGAGNTTF